MHFNYIYIYTSAHFFLENHHAYQECSIDFISTSIRRINTKPLPLALHCAYTGYLRVLSVCRLFASAHCLSKHCLSAHCLPVYILSVCTVPAIDLCRLRCVPLPTLILCSPSLFVMMSVHRREWSTLQNARRR